MLDLDVKKAYKCDPAIPDQKAFSLRGATLFKEKMEYTTPTEVGVEIEIEKVESLPPLTFWRYENDGSLKNAGKELISYPYKNENVLYAITEFCKLFVKANPNAEFSHRCSMHVHINVAKLTVGQLYCLIATYIVLEDLFFHLVPNERKGNSYCWPLSDGFLNRRDLEPSKINEHFKYAALNPHHLRDYGTLEFRQHGGSKDKKEILNWIETILRLYSFVEKNNPNDVALAIKNLNSISNYEDFARTVLQDKFAQFMGLPLESMLRNNVTAAKLFLE